MAAAQASLAKAFKALHKPGSPIILANVYDAATARAVAALPSSRAIATSSFAIAAVAGSSDDDLTRELNFKAAETISNSVKEFGKPLSVDFQDGYGERLEDALTELIKTGAVGINLEDYNREEDRFYTPDEAAARVQRAVKTAHALGIPDFVVNARSDVLVHGGELSEVVSRGKKYLAAGATTVFVWGASRGVSRDEVKELVEAFDGRLNVLMKPSNGLTAKELSDLGVARISIGISLYLAALAKFKEEAEKVLQV
jgi:2-methylisocitrate lyase-like PEP mutase family enzyme